MWALWVIGGFLVGYLVACFTVQLIIRQLRKEEKED